MVNSTEEFWDVDGVSLQTLTQNLKSWGDREAPPPLRGDDVVVPSAPGEVFLPKQPGARVIPLHGWVLGSRELRTVMRRNIARNPKLTGTAGIFAQQIVDGGDGPLSANRLNGALNPRATQAAGFASWIAGTAEAGTTTYVTGAADGPRADVTTYARRSITTKKTGGSSGFQAYTSGNRPQLTGTAGQTATVAVWARYTGTGTVQAVLRLQPYSAAGAGAATVDGPATTLTSGAWVRFEVSVTAAADFASIGWYLYQTAGNVPQNGSTIDMVGVDAELAPAPLGPYFDGTTAPPADGVNGWTGPADASPTAQENLVDGGTVGDAGTVYVLDGGNI